MSSLRLTELATFIPTPQQYAAFNEVRLINEAKDGFKMSVGDAAGQLRMMAMNRIINDVPQPELRQFLMAALDLVDWQSVARSGPGGVSQR